MGNFHSSAVLGFKSSRRLFLDLVVNTLGISIGLAGSPAFGAEGFFRFHELPSEHRPSSEGFRTALQASFRGTIGVGLEMQCSVQFLSPDGYALTALHCMESLPALWETFEITPEGRDSAKWYHVARPVSATPFYSRRVSGTVPGVGDFSVRAQVTLLGRGFTASFPDFFRDYGWDSGPEAREQVRLHSEDFMILKLELPRPAPCVKVSDSLLTPGTPVWAVGYPDPATRPNGHHSDGNAQFITYGEVNSSYAGSDALLAQGASAQVAAEYDQMLLGGPKVVLSNDAFVGMSGGMVLNSSGELVATIAGGWSTETVLSKGSTRAVKASEIKRITRELLGDQKASQIFNCP